MFNEAPPAYSDFSAVINNYPTGSWIQYKSNFAAGITLSAARDLNCTQSEINPESGSVNLLADGKLTTNLANIKSGYFSGNNATAQGKNITLNASSLSSLFGTASVIGRDSATLTNVRMQGGKGVFVSAPTLNVSNSTFTQGTKGAATPKSTGAAQFVGNTVSIASSQVKAKGSVLVNGKDFAKVVGSTLEGVSTLITTIGKLDLSFSNLIGEYNRLEGKTIHTADNTFSGRTDLAGKDKVTINGLKADDTVTATAKDIELSKTVNAGSLHATGNHVKSTANVTIQDDLSLNGKIVEQLNKATAGNSVSIIATEKYIDGPQSVSEAGKSYALHAKTTSGFKGQVKAPTSFFELEDMNLLALLNQTESRETTAILPNTAVSFDKDTVIDRTLHLLAKSLGNTKNLTVKGDFLAQIQSQIINTGFINIFGKGSLESDTFTNSSGTIEADDLRVKARHILCQRLVQTNYTPHGVVEKFKDPSLLNARRGGLTVHATQVNEGVGADYVAQKKVHLKSDGVLSLRAQAANSNFTFNKGKRTTHYGITTHATSNAVSHEDDVVTESEKGTLLQGVSERAAGEITNSTNGTFIATNARNVLEFDSGKGKHDKEQQTKVEVIQNLFKAGGHVTFQSVDDTTLQAPIVESGGKISIKSKRGRVYLTCDKDLDMFSLQKSEKDMLLQSQENLFDLDEHGIMPIFRAKEGVSIEGARGISVEVVKVLNQLEQDPGLAWIKEVRKNPSAQFKFVEEEHEHVKHSSQSLTPAATALIAVAVACVTAGAGLAATMTAFAAEAVGTGTLSGALGAMGTAGATTLASQSICSLVNNQGHVGHFLKDMTSKEQLEGLGISMGVAGLSFGIASKLGISPQSTDFSNRLANSAVQTSVASAVNAAKGGDIGQNVLQAGINTAVSVASYAVADQIGTCYRAGDIDGVLHKVLHAGSGFLQGMASNLDDPIRGGVGGTFAALAEVVYEALPAGSLSPNARANIAIMSAATAAFFTKQDVNAAALTATNAVYHNAQGGDKDKEQVVKIEEGRGEFRGLIENPDRKIMEPLGIVSDLADIDIPGLKNVRDGAHVVWDTVSGKVQLIPNLEEYKIAFKNMPSRYRVAFLPLDCIVHTKEIGHHIIDLTPTKGYEVPLMLSGVGIGGKALQPVGREAGPLLKLGQSFFPRLFVKDSPEFIPMGRYVGEVGSNSGFYSSHAMREMLELRYPGRVTSSTVPALNGKNVKLAGQRHPQSGIIFDTKGFPIFDDIAKFEAKLSNNLSSVRNPRLHMREATKDLRNQILNGKIERNQFTHLQLEDIMAGKDRIAGYTWHHHQDIGKMQLIPKEAHQTTGHVGGMDMWFKTN